MASIERPNILLITTDQQRYDTLGVTGNRLVQTPNIDALAARGVVFDHGYIQNPVCVPSRACIQTGRYVHQHGVEFMSETIGDTPGLPPWETTFMEHLQTAGYASAAFGKIHMLPPRGFDEMQLTMGKGQRWTVADGSALGPSQLGPVYADWLENRRPGAYEQIYEQRRGPEYRDSMTAIVNALAPDEYVDHWIGENTSTYLDREHERSFFVWSGFCGPHGPFDPPQPYASMYSPDNIPVPPLFRKRQHGAPRNAVPAFDGPQGEDLIRRLIAHYWAMMSLIDDMVGRIMSVLTERGLWDNTMVIFTTDHGEMLGDFGQLGKGNFLEQVIRVPYIIVPPGSGPPPTDTRPRHVDDLVEHVDLAPTILDYANVAVPSGLSGRSLRALIENDSSRPAPRDSVLCEYTTNDRSRRSICLRTHRYKYIVHNNGQATEFYDLIEDPTEQVNVATDVRHTNELLRHAELLIKRLTGAKDNSWNTAGAFAARHELDHFGRPTRQRA